MAEFTGKCMYNGQNVDVKVEYDPSNTPLSNADKNIIISYVWSKDESKVHKTKIRTGPADGAEGYFHNRGENSLLAFKDVTFGEFETTEQPDPKDKTKKVKVHKMKKAAKVKFVATGDVNNNVHKFKKL